MVYRGQSQLAEQAEHVRSLQAKSLDAALQDRSARSWLAQLLRGASRALDSLAAHLALNATKLDAEEPTLEYHAEAGAPEGALYVNGQLVGRLMGVARL
jgi:hypothetical protein